MAHPTTLYVERDLEDAAGGGGDAVGVAGAVTDNPEDGVVGVDEEELALLGRQGEMVVGEEVADQLGAVGHTEGLETVAVAPMAQGEGLAEGIGIEEDGVGREGLVVGRKGVES